MAGRVFVGIAGWVYPDWRGGFYPPGLVQSGELGYASARLGAIEINATFYSAQSPRSFRSWAGQVPENFVFSLKGPRFITQSLKLRDAEGALANFFASGVLALGKKLGPVLWSMPNSFAFDAGGLEQFFSLLPRNGAAAARLAERHDTRVKDPLMDASGVGALRYTLEVRHSSFRSAEAIALCRHHDVALCVLDTEDWPVTDITAGHAYLRLQGPPAGPRYSESDLDEWASVLFAWSQGAQGPLRPTTVAPVADGQARDVFAFFVSNDKVNAPANAQGLIRRLVALGADAAPSLPSV